MAWDCKNNSSTPVSAFVRLVTLAFVRVFTRDAWIHRAIDMEGPGGENRQRCWLWI